jgi:hypothetical protein
VLQTRLEIHRGVAPTLRFYIGDRLSEVPSVTEEVLFVLLALAEINGFMTAETAGEQQHQKGSSSGDRS